MLLTDEKIQWFWGQCGLVKIKRGWKLPNGDVLLDIDPPIDPNNLFKYAVLKLEYVSLTKHIDEDNGSIWFEANAGRYLFDALYQEEHNTDPALALFWAIYKAFGGK